MDKKTKIDITLVAAVIVVLLSCLIFLLVTLGN